MNDRSREAVRHEPIVRESLKQNTEDPAAQAQAREELPRSEGPDKQQGDALLDGSGTRHGVNDLPTDPNSKVRRREQAPGDGSR